jgi:hypothetical protein
MNEKVEDIIYLIQQSSLDQTIKDILIRDLKAEGLTDFLREQILSYCSEGLKIIDKKLTEAKKSLEEQTQQNPPA